MIIQTYSTMLAAVLIFLLLMGCDLFDEHQTVDKTYETRMKEAQNLKDKAEKLYLEGMSNEAGTDERNSNLREAYGAGEKAMNILNQLDEQFGHRAVPEGEILAHRPIMQSLSELMDHIVRAMSAVD